MRCIQCGSTKHLQRHHKLSQSKLNRKLYGDLLDDPRNISILCEACHLWKGIERYSEIAFCEKMGIKPRSKTGRLIWDRKHKPNCECDVCNNDW